ncbi:MAG: peptidyl-tRNA hydrolase Pth2 [Candidatus Thalassarchaeaceae archaeon]|jgi:PTH2 family peptidyl-tRNA hydrolase|nr:peptidyl-tRNA hydrolase Pth2 [Candidatus Thalassarchaeaceae archaeon]MED5398486.1 peptidyl-tRNA hydrolase Pth2 [Candidatus Thermoplasmatota archaeon]
MVLVTRQDLILSKGKLAAQCSHATAQCVLLAKRNSPRSLDRYLKHGARKIVCKAPDLTSLKQIHKKAKKSGLISHLVIDAGHTEIPPGTETVLGVGPGPRKEIDKITGDLPLVS